MATKVVTGELRKLIKRKGDERRGKDETQGGTGLGGLNGLVSPGVHRCAKGTKLKRFRVVA